MRGEFLFGSRLLAPNPNLDLNPNEEITIKIKIRIKNTLRQDQMNVHQLELFFHVVLNQGVSAAARALEKEQPTLSKQINELEDSLCAKLYHRRPFRLTEKGETLFRAIEPFFRDLPRLEQQVRGGDLIRIGASPVFLTDHLPAVERQVRKAFPNLHLVLCESNQPQLLQKIERGEIDLAITLLPDQLPGKIFGRPLHQLPLVLLAPKEHKLLSAGQLWAQPQIHVPLICLAPEEMICRQFQQTLKRMGIQWRPGMEVGSLALVARYVQEGYGIGLSVRIPGATLPPKVRAIELPDFPAIPLGLLWRDNQDKLVRAFREGIEERAARIAPPPHGQTPPAKCAAPSVKTIAPTTH
jgi:LysR family positive regulator for ilvC